MSRAIRNSDQTTFDKVRRKMDLLEEIILTVTIFGAICFIATGFLFAYSILGGLS